MIYRVYEKVTIVVATLHMVLMGPQQPGCKAGNEEGRNESQKGIMTLLTYPVERSFLTTNNKQDVQDEKQLSMHIYALPSLPLNQN